MDQVSVPGSQGRTWGAWNHETKNTHHCDPANTWCALRNGRKMIEPFPILPVRLLRPRDRLDVLLQRAQQLLEFALIGLLARPSDE